MNGATLPLYVAKWGRFLRQAMQETLQKAYEARMGLIAQQQDMHGKLTPSDIARHRSHIATARRPSWSRKNLIPLRTVEDTENSDKFDKFEFGVDFFAPPFSLAIVGDQEISEM